MHEWLLAPARERDVFLQRAYICIVTVGHPGAILAERGRAIESELFGTFWNTLQVYQIIRPKLHSDTI